MAFGDIEFDREALHRLLDGPRKAKDRTAELAKSLPLASAVTTDGDIVELVRDPATNQTHLCVGCYHASWELVESVVVQDRRFVPYSPHNNLLQNEVVLLPSAPEEYGSEADLMAAIQSYIHRYVDVSFAFEQAAAYYVLFSWVHDAFNELPYLRARGDYGCGKTRFLQIVGSICYKPIFASGASTVAPLFRILDAFRGTLILDESDFRLTDERAQIVKILNNGNAKGFPVLRCEVSDKKEFDPRAYHVFGPKLVASRGPFEDRALESRFLTEEMGGRKLREDIPINLPDDYKAEALHLRNQLLLYRLRNLHKQATGQGLLDTAIEPRLNQIFIPLLSVIPDATARDRLKELARGYQQDIQTERGQETEAQVLEVIRALVDDGEAKLSIKAVTQWFADRYAEDYERKITPKWIGWTIRHKLHLKTRKSDGVFVIPPEEMPHLRRLWEKYDIAGADPDKPSVEADSIAF